MKPAKHEIHLQVHGDKRCMNFNRQTLTYFDNVQIETLWNYIYFKRINLTWQFWLLSDDRAIGREATPKV